MTWLRHYWHRMLAKLLPSPNGTPKTIGKAGIPQSFFDDLDGGR